MIDHDKNIGQMLDYLDELALADNTFVMYSTDNGPHMNSLAGRRHDAVPQREEHQLGGRLSGAWMIVRWPGKIAPGRISNEIIQHHDWLPTFLAMAGDPDVVDKAQDWLSGHRPDLPQPHRRLQPSCLISPARRRRVRASSSCI